MLAKNAFDPGLDERDPTQAEAANNSVHLNAATGLATATHTPAYDIADRPHARRGRAVTVWWFNDGKPGHANQSFGLIKALHRLFALEVHELTPMTTPNALVSLATGVYVDGASLPRPDLIIGAGHRTHLSMLAARRAFGGRIIVLMKPSLPLTWFDLCLIPEHDQPTARDNVITTRGVLNTVEPIADKDTSKGLILIGGLSKHFKWDDDAILAQVNDIVRHAPSVRWTISDSRRTPASLSKRLSLLLAPNVEFIGHQQTPNGWVAQQMRDASVIWTSADSVSMIYEGLTSGANVGILQLEPSSENRIVRGLKNLEAARQVTGFPQWEQTKTVAVSTQPLHEAERCALRIAERYPTPA